MGSYGCRERDWMRSPVVLLASVLLGMPQFVGTPVAWAQSAVGGPGQQVQVNIPPAAGGHEAGPAADDAKALAEKLQNPIGDLISVPFQNNTNFNVGPHAGTQDILNIQPVIPIHLNQDWTLITRTIVPLVWSPSFQPAESVPFGLSATTVTAFLAPSRPVNGWLWGAQGNRVKEYVTKGESAESMTILDSVVEAGDGRRGDGRSGCLLASFQ